MKSLSCPNRHCPPSKKGDARAIFRHGFYKTRWGKRRRFSDRKMKRIAMAKIQADEIRTIVGGKEQPIWVFAVIEVWFRLWPSTIVGKRGFRNTLALFRDVSKCMNPRQIPLITTDGFEFYKKVIERVFGPACLYGQVIKTRRSDRIVKVERRTVIGGAWRLQQALRDSEDSVNLNTSFIARLNLTIRQGSAYLFRRRICQAAGSNVSKIIWSCFAAITIS